MALLPSSLPKLAFLPVAYCARQLTGSENTMSQRAYIPSVALIALLGWIVHLQHLH
jgi:hypothetical protein